MALIKIKFGPKPLTSLPSRRRAIIDMIFAAAIWGFGFTANEIALRSLTSFEILLYRFIIALIAGELIRSAFFRDAPAFDKGDLKKAWPAGILLSIFLIFQTVGMEYTTATNSGFITTLYVIFVPLLNHIFLKIKAPFLVYLMAGLALIGAFLLMGGKIDQFNKGDMLTMGCAVVGAIHIIYLGKVSRNVKDVIRFNNWQSAICIIPIIPFLFFTTKTPFENITPESWGGVFYMAIGSSAIAFSMQVRAQKVLSDTTASMLFLLESPFAFLFGFLFLAERLGWISSLGALLILISSALTILWDSPGYSNTKNSK